MMPVKTYLVRFARVVRKLRLVKTTNAKIPTDAMLMRHQTSGMLEMEINFPRIPVNPQIKIIACNAK